MIKEGIAKWVYDWWGGTERYGKWEEKPEDERESWRVEVGDKICKIIASSLPDMGDTLIGSVHSNKCIGCKWQFDCNWLKDGHWCLGKQMEVAEKVAQAYKDRIKKWLEG